MKARQVQVAFAALLSLSGVLGQQPLISTGNPQAALGGSDLGDAYPSGQTTAASNSATGAAAAPVVAPAPAPFVRAQTPKVAPKPAPKQATGVPPAKVPVGAPAASKQAAKAPGAAPGPAKAAAAKMGAASSKAPAPSKAPAREAADITNIIQARAGAVTRANTLFLAGVGSRVDWLANLGSEGRRAGRFPVEQFTSDSFNQSAQGSNAWLGNPQAVLQGILSGQQNSTTLVAILSAPIWNATAETLTFGMRPVTSEAALKLRDGVANGAFAAGRNESLSSNAVGVVLRDVVVYVDDSSARKASGMEKGVSLGLNSCKAINGGPWRGPWIFEKYSGCL